MKPKRIIWILIFTILLSPVQSSSAEQDNVLPRSGTDRPDDLNGYQVRLIYVVPSDRPDRQLDEKGYLNNWITQIIYETRVQIGLTPRFDKYEGKYDIGYLKSKYTVKELSSFEGDDLLLDELPVSDTLKLKGIGFVIDGKLDSLRYCGYAGRPGSSFVAYLGPNCWEDTSRYNENRKSTWISRTILHEWLHNLGVEHTCVENDLMHGEGCDSVPQGSGRELDAQRQNYLRASKSGVDISLLPVWEETFKLGKITLPFSSTVQSNDPWRGSKLLKEIWGVFSLNKDWAVRSKVQFTCSVITSSGVTLVSSVKNGTCESNIPDNLGIGTVVYMTMKATGLWHESSKTLSFRVKGEQGETEFCESSTCIAGETLKIGIDFCFKVGGFAALQRKSGDQWIDLKVHKSVSNTSGCKGEFPFTFETFIRSLDEGVHTLRWVRSGNRKFSPLISTYKEFQLNIKQEVTK